MPNIALSPRDTATTTYGVTGERRVVDMADTIALLQPDAAPLLLLTQKLGKREAINAKFNWQEDELTPSEDAINFAAGYDNAAVALVVDNANYFTKNDIVLLPATEEIVLVTNVNIGTNTLTVVRGYSDDGKKDAIANNAALLIIGSAYEEGAEKQLAPTTKIAVPYNYTEIFRTAFGVTRTLNNSELYGGNQLDYERKKKGIEHAVKMERSAFFGKRKEDLTGTHARRTTGGLLHQYLTENILAVGGALTESKWEDWLRLLFRHGRATRTVFCSSLIISVISAWARGKLQTVPKDKTYGINVMQYLSPHGIVNLVNHKEVLRGSVYGGYAVGLDLEQIKYRPLRNSDTKLKTNIQNPSEDGEIDEFLTEGGWEIKTPKLHGILTGVTG